MSFTVSSIASQHLIQNVFQEFGHRYCVFGLSSSSKLGLVRILHDLQFFRRISGQPLSSEVDLQLWPITNTIVNFTNTTYSLICGCNFFQFFLRTCALLLIYKRVLLCIFLFASDKVCQRILVILIRRFSSRTFSKSWFFGAGLTSHSDLNFIFFWS